MLTKILFTLAVIIVVVLVFRNKRNAQAAHSAEPAGASRSLSTRLVAYVILGVLIAISVGVFVINYQSNNQIITIKVIAEDGMSTIYQAKQKFIKGRRFVTLDGRQVALGDSDRMEVTP